MKAKNKVTNFSISKLLLDAILAFFDFVAPCWKLICVKERVFVEENGTKTELSLKVIPFCCLALFGETSFDFVRPNFLRSIIEKECPILFLIHFPMRLIRTPRVTRKGRAWKYQPSYSDEVLSLVSQFNAYKRRKFLLFKRMKYASIFLCFVICFLCWLLYWLPMKNRQFWNRGMSFQICLGKVLFFGLIKRSSLWHWFHTNQTKVYRYWRVQRIPGTVRG